MNKVSEVQTVFVPFISSEIQPRTRGLLHGDFPSWKSKEHATNNQKKEQFEEKLTIRSENNN